MRNIRKWHQSFIAHFINNFKIMNVLLDRRNVKYKMDNDLIDTGTDPFGSVIGNNCSIGPSVIILPGRKVLPNTQIQTGSIIKN